EPFKLPAVLPAPGVVRLKGEPVTVTPSSETVTEPVGPLGKPVTLDEGSALTVTGTTALWPETTVRPAGIEITVGAGLTVCVVVAWLNSSGGADGDGKVTVTLASRGVRMILLAPGVVT